MDGGFSSWAQVGDLLRSKGVSTVFVKPLAKNQDNEKNQIYIAAGSGSGVLDKFGQTLPLVIRKRGTSGSTKKRLSAAGESIWEGAIRWHWLDRAGTAHRAEHTKAIFYFQFPEIRLSGFLRGTTWSPDAIRREKQDSYGSRALVFGTGSDENVFALVVTSATDPNLFPILGLETHPRNPLLLTFRTNSNSEEILLRDLKVIHEGRWHKSMRLKAVGVPAVEFRGTQGAGYTLEALLGIPSNPDKTPDRDGIEIKSFSTPKVSLITPTPDGGVQGIEGLMPFLERFGTRSTDDAELIHFNGSHRCGFRQEKTQLLLSVTGYDKTSGFHGTESDVVVALTNADGVVAASWSYVKLFESWNKKHAKAAYVSSFRNPDVAGSLTPEYRFASTVYVCTGTSSRKLLDAILEGVVVYDPGDTSKSKKTGKPKPRPQWRLTNIKNLAVLYDKVEKHHFD